MDEVRARAGAAEAMVKQQQEQQEQWQPKGLLACLGISRSGSLTRIGSGSRVHPDRPDSATARGGRSDSHSPDRPLSAAATRTGSQAALAHDKQARLAAPQAAWMD